MHVNPKPKPPLPGGEHTFVTDTGRQGVRPGIPVVNLIPVGDGGPGPLLPRTFKRKDRKPVLPDRAEIARLPLLARVAFAARCARRVLSVYRNHARLDGFESEAVIVDTALRLTERFPYDAARVAEEAYAGTYVPDTNVVSDNAADAALSAVASAERATRFADACGAGSFEAESDEVTFNVRAAAFSAAQAILLTSSDPSDLSFIRRDFSLARRLAKMNRWADDTPVPPEVFGPLWPEGREPEWAKETPEPHE